MSEGAAVRSEEPAGRVRRTAALTATPFVTGGGGFAGRHLVELLAAEGRVPVSPSSSELDLLDRPAVEHGLRAAAPGAIFHLAAFSSPRLSWDQPDRALLTNLEMTLNVLEAARVEAPRATVVLVSSGQVYGEPESLPVAEEAPLDPRNPYAVSKASCDMLGRQYATAHDMRVVRLRPFNHAGPGQSDDYVVSTLARQVAEAEREGRAAALLRTGDVHVARDFTDVRDVVRAYVLAAGLEPGAYNVCSGRSVAIAELIDLLRHETRVELRQEDDPERMRAHDARQMRGSRERLTTMTGWVPEIPLAQTVRDTLDWWRRHLRDQP
ncbi:MAG: GDP-mannose 4,6-dehydratase [Actinomycetota bacterium]|nr:GDP-mannose 4,6-dehydratase [Actinomycetota bacterium]